MINLREGKVNSLENQCLIDNLTLSRKVNMPELIFNVDLHKDQYFDANAEQNWQIILNSECFICDYHRLTVIMYDQSLNPTHNPELIEIKDQ